jgi:topoisomerase-4 subunit A
LELGLIESAAKVSEPEEESDSKEETDQKEETDTTEAEEDLEIGSTVEFKIKKDEDKDQLGLF